MIRNVIKGNTTKVEAIDNLTYRVNAFLIRVPTGFSCKKWWADLFNFACQVQWSKIAKNFAKEEQNRRTNII